MRAAAIAASLACVAACGGGQPTASGAPVDLALATPAGPAIDLRALRGQIVVLHLFTVGSLGAVVDVGQLNAAHARDGVSVIGVALDPEGGQFVEPWRTEANAAYPVGLADADMARAQPAIGDIEAVPATLVLDAEGRVLKRIDRQLAPGELARILDRARPSG